jgi:hypothetical protein
MKKLFILMFLFISSLVFCQYRILNTFYAYDGIKNEIKVSIVEYENKKGFLIDSEIEDKKFFFLTEKSVYKNTINKNMINYKWFVWKDCASEMLMVPVTVFCVSSIDWDTGDITFTFNMALLGGRLDNYYITFSKDELR